MTALGLEQLSIADLKAQFEKAFGSISGTGTNSSFSTTCTLKLGALDLDEEGFEGLRGWEDASKYYIKGKVISSDRQGNIYKSLFIYDGTAAIELKLYSGLYMDFYLDLEDMVSQWVYVRLDGLYLGNYRMMLSIGDAPSDGYNARPAATSTTPTRISTIRRSRHSNVFAGEDDARCVGYPGGGREQLPHAAHGRCEYQKCSGTSGAFQECQGALRRGQGPERRCALDDHRTAPIRTPIRAGSLPTGGDAQFGTWYYWAYNRNNVRLYGSVMISYDDAAKYTSDPGIYTVRTSGYSQFAMKPIPKNGAVGTVLGIFGIYSQKSDFTGGSYDYAQYQISVSRLEDLQFAEEDLLTEEWIQANTPAESLNPPVKVGGDDYENQ